MAIDTVLVFVSLLCFATLVIIWIAAPLHADEPSPTTATEAAHNTVAA